VSITITDLFCGAGGSSLGAQVAGAEIVMAANHWPTAIDVHQKHFPNAAHDCADISQADPRRYPRTRVLIASPECTNHSQARGVSRKRQDPSLWDAPDPSAERSRATMWDVVRFAEQMHYDAIVVENVVEATKWVLWPAWRTAMESLGYRLTLLSHNSMDHQVPQSRDRIYAVWFRNGIRANLEMERDAWCPRCAGVTVVRQAWKNGRTVGRYGAQWVWACTTCGARCAPSTEPAASIIDWSLACPPFGSKRRAEKTRERVWAGMVRHGWVPITTSGAGNVHERTPGNRARTLDEPVATQQTTLTSALATPPPFMMATHHEGRTSSIDEPHPTVTASNDRLSLVVPLRNHGRARHTGEPVPTVSAGGNHHGLIITNRSTTDGDPARRSATTDEPLTTIVSDGRHHGLVTSYNGNGQTHQADEPLTAVVGTARHALLMRNNSGGAEMVTPVTEPARTMTTAGHQSLITWPLDPEQEAILDAVGFRMLEPYEVAAAMAFPAGYIPLDLTKDVQVKLAGNAVTPPVMSWIIERVIQALENAA
jgi:DNA (cytosine-5)-methyltransferase 1